MRQVKEQDGYGVTIFKPGTTAREKFRGILFFILMSTIIFVQACYWLFANKVQPIVLGMPFGMFFVVLFIVIEFTVLALFYLTEYKK